MEKRKVNVDITVRLVMELKKGTSVDTVINELDYNFEDTTGQAKIANTEIIHFEINKMNTLPDR
jgi:hypothetical protein